MATYRRFSIHVPYLVNRLRIGQKQTEELRELQKSFNEIMEDLHRYLRYNQDNADGGLPPGAYSGIPAALEVGSAGEPGEPTDGWAPALHEHPMPTGTPAGLGNAVSEGVSVLFPRLDHVHKRDVRFKANDADVAIRNAPNFVDGDVEWTLNDDLPNDEVEISAKLSDTGRTFPAGGTLLGTSSPSDAIVWEAPFAATVLAVRGIWRNGLGAPTVAINARRNFTSEHLASDLSLPVAGTMYDGGAVQNTAYVAGDILEARIKTFMGGTADVTVVIRLRRN